MYVPYFPSTWPLRSSTPSPTPTTLTPSPLPALQGLRESIPPNFPYFYVQFGYGSGYVHVIDDETKFDPNFGRQVRGVCALVVAECAVSSRQRRCRRPSNTVSPELALQCVCCTSTPSVMCSSPPSMPFPPSFTAGVSGPAPPALPFASGHFFSTQHT